MLTNILVYAKFKLAIKKAIGCIPGQLEPIANNQKQKGGCNISIAPPP